MSAEARRWFANDVVDMRDAPHFAHEHRTFGAAKVVGPYAVALAKVDGQGSVRAYSLEYGSSARAICIMTDSSDGSVPMFNHFAGRYLQLSEQEWKVYGNGSARAGVVSAMQACALLSATESAEDYIAHQQLRLDIINEILDRTHK